MNELVVKQDDKDVEGRIVGYNKARDVIILKYLAEGNTQDEVVSILKEYDPPIEISRNRISVIKTQNLNLLNELTLKAPLSSKAGRLRRAMIVAKNKMTSKKDIIDILDYMRKEEQGEVRGPTVITIINNIPTPWENEQKQ